MIGASGGGSPIIFILLIGFGVVYFLFVRPQKKKQSKQQQMVNELRVGDEVLTAGGIYGTISQLDEDEVTVEIAPKTEVRVARRAIAGVMTEPEEKEEEDEPEADEAAESEEHEASHDDEGAEAQPSNEENRG